MDSETKTITRINFLEREAFKPTYRKMAIVSAGVVGFCLLMVGFQTTRLFWMERKGARLTTEINALRAERQKVLLSVTKLEGMGIAERVLRSRLEKGPGWSTVLKTLEKQMPASVWLESLKTYEKAESPSGRGIILIGQAPSAAEVSSFLKVLGARRPFSRVVLTSSGKEKTGRYHFTIEAFVQAGGES